MAEFLLSHDLEGRDVQAPANLNTGESSIRQGAPSRGRILLSMVGLDGTAHHSAILLPASYLEAMAMAVDSFHIQISSAGTAVQDLVLKLGMKSSSGPVAWASLRPEQWIDIIRDGDEIQLGLGDGAKVVAGSNDLAPLITFKYLDGEIYKYATILLSETLTVKDIEKDVRRAFRFGPNVRLFLKGLVMGKDGDMIKTAIPSKWHSVVRQMVKENPSFEILVERK